MLKRFLVASCFVSLVACVQQDDAPDGIARALPTPDEVAIKLPDTAARSANQYVVGQIADWYVATRNVTRTFNGGSAWVLTLIHAIVQFPVTTISGDTYTWGPWSEALDPAEYKLDVRVVGDGTYAYQLSGRSKTQAGAQFEVVIDGTADPRAGDRRGSGAFLIDFDAGKRVNPLEGGNDKGSVQAQYDLARRHLDLTILSTDALGKPVVADYSYDETDAEGNMVFEFSADAGGGPLLETATLHSHWLLAGPSTGAGRTDARLAGGNLGAVQATASECWDPSFRRVFYTDSVNLAATEGDQAACAFATADLPPAN